ncbi:GTPase, G3E family [Anoxybacillus pushchinoensis]|uniref:GTPase, G3E family n=1 Tax=Anoxybacillus pushchinoensis TaxID=150248 RepID=A0A1I0U4Z5_9BACL|nr:GTP-binding protein [Anoxybacillus pushchinoensis]SFA58226.1 GTPase, G3E family [Anoxybacillus pushchinoensis]
MKHTDIYILSGFLGSGKTTLLKRFLQSEKERGRKIAVVMNEIGQVSIDSHAVSEDAVLSELLSGCVCCTIQDQFEVELYSLLRQHALDVIYIETTGVAHPVEVLDACISPLFARRVQMRGIITTIDATRWSNRQQLSVPLQMLLKEQVRHADVLIINKTDELCVDAQAKLSFELQAINSDARIIFTTYSNVRIDDIHLLSHRPRNEHGRLNVERLRIQTYVHTFTKPIDLHMFERWVRQLPDTIYRMKGFLRFTHTSGVYSFQYAYGTPLYMKEEMNVPLHFVIIGEQLDKQRLKQQLDDMQKGEG